MTNIKLLRIAKGISQKKLAEDAGVSAPYIYDLEHGNRGAKPETLERIAKALGVTVEELTEDE